MTDCLGPTIDKTPCRSTSHQITPRWPCDTARRLVVLVRYSGQKLAKVSLDVTDALSCGDSPRNGSLLHNESLKANR